MNTSRFLFLLLLTAVSSKLPGQPDTLFRPSLRVGFDVSAMARSFLAPEVRVLEVSSDLEWRENWFAAIEGGMVDIDMERSTHSYEAGGWFLRFGADYNFLHKKDAIHQDLVIASVRYGMGRLTHMAPLIVVSDPYWGDYSTSMESGRHLGHWLEFGGGLKTRIGRNFFMGWSVRTRFLITQSRESLITPYMLPGYGRSGKNTTVMLHYSLYYRIPLSGRPHGQ
jgi:hypothetical protein